MFDGIGCGRLAIQRAGIEVDRYVAYEIDKDAIKVARSNWPDIEQEGTVIGADFKQYEGFDLLIGGSPCQGFSSSGKQLNFEDPRSKLFFEFSRAVKEVKPKFFMLENVCMKKEWMDIISDNLGVEPIEINSALVSAQNRKRLYWTNIPGIEQPADKGITLQDILEDVEFANTREIQGRKLNKGTIIGRRINGEGHRDDYNHDIPITQCLEVRAMNTDKSGCLTTVEKDNVLTPLPVGRHMDAFKNKLPFRYYTLEEYCRLQTIPSGYMQEVSEAKAKKMLGNGWTVDVIAHILSYIRKGKTDMDRGEEGAERKIHDDLQQY